MSLLKRIGTTARKEIESLLGTRVFLELFVKVHEDWRSSSTFVEDLDWRRQLEEIAAMVPILAVDRGDKDFERRIARPCPHSRQRSVDPHRAALRADDRVGHAK